MLMIIQKKSFPEHGNLSLPPPAHPSDPPAPWPILAQYSGNFPSSAKATDEFGFVPTSNCA